MPSTLYGFLDLIQNELRNAVVQNLGAAPTAPAPKKGQLYMNSSDNNLYWYDGTQWWSAKGNIIYGAVTAEQVFGGASANGVATSVSRSDHTHGNPTHAFADHSTYRLDQWAVPTAAVNLNNQKITNLADPTLSSDAASKNYVDVTTQGLDAKASVKAATTPAGGNITLSGAQTIDGIALVAADRCLVKDQTLPAQNGIYIVQIGTWTRAPDNDSWTEVPSAYVWVEQGTVNADSGWVCTADQGGTLGTTVMPWTQFSGAGQITAGAGLTKTGNQIDVGAGSGILVAADSISVDTTVVQPADSDLTAIAGLATTGLISRTGTGTAVTRSLAGTAPITVTNPDGVAGNPTVAITQFAGSAPGSVPTSPGGTNAFLRADGVWGMPLYSGPTKYAAALAGTASPEVITHNLGTRDIHLMVLNGASPYTAVDVDWDATTTNTATIRYSPNLGAGYRCVVIG